MTPRALLAHYSAVVQLVRYLVEDQTGGVLGAAVEMINKVTSAKGVMAYSVEGHELVLVAESGLPRRAKAWLAHLPIDDEPWFIAQRVAVSQRGEVGSRLADSRMGHSIQPALEAEGWRSLACSPIRAGRNVHGVIVLATGGTTFDKQTLVFLDAICGILGLSCAREAVLHHARDESLQAQKTAELATLGLLASTLANEIAAPLDRVRGGLTELTEVGLVGSPDELETLRSALASVDDARSVARRFSEMTCEGETESVELGRCVHQTLSLLASSVEDRGIQLSVSDAERGLYVEGRRAALEMLIVQLVLHATDECAAARVEEPQVRLSLSATDGNCVLDVEMSGSVGQRSGARIFEGVLRGKSSAASAGLELAQTTVAAHGGSVELSVSDLGGARIRITLPETLADETDQPDDAAHALDLAPQIAPPPRAVPQPRSYASPSPLPPPLPTRRVPCRFASRPPSERRCGSISSSTPKVTISRSTTSQMSKKTRPPREACRPPSRRRRSRHPPPLSRHPRPTRARARSASSCGSTTTRPSCAGWPDRSPHTRHSWWDPSPKRPSCSTISTCSPRSSSVTSSSPTVSAQTCTKRSSHSSPSDSSS